MTTDDIALPPLAQTVPTSKPYRLYTRAYVSFDAFPPYSEGGPAKVVVDGWAVSYTTGGDGPGAVLSLWRPNPNGPLLDGAIYHELHRTRFESVEAASRAAFEAGALAFMVYEEGER